MPELAATGEGLAGARGSDSTDQREISRLPIDEHHLNAVWSLPEAIAPTRDRWGQTANALGPTSLQQGAGASAPNGELTILPLRVKPVPMASLHPTQEWEGYVIEVREDDFEARLLDLTAGDPVAREDAVIPLEELDDDDRATLAIGAIFRWVIGYERSPAGARRSVSQIVFLDLPPLRECDLDRGREWADRLRQKWGLG